MRLIAILLASAVMTLPACSAERFVAADAPAKVDLQQVVATGKVAPVGGITPAGQPDAAAFKVFADSGYKAVIDLRTAGEDRGLNEQAVVEGLGMAYLPMPIGRGDITIANAKALDDLIKSSSGPVLVHCASSNRVGALLALRAALNGADDASALQIGRRGGLTGLEQTVRDVLDSDQE